MADEPAYLRIANYRRYQHYRERRPPWVKQYRDFWTDYDLSIQKSATRLLALFLISYASEFKNELIPCNFFEISRRASLSKYHVEFGVEALNDAGFLEIVASTALAPCKQNARPLSTEDRERERKPPLTPPSEIGGILSELGEVNEKRLALVIDGLPKKDHRGEAVALVDWALAKGIETKDVVSRYRNWLKKAPDRLQEVAYPRSEEPV